MEDSVKTIIWTLVIAIVAGGVLVLTYSLNKNETPFEDREINHTKIVSGWSCDVIDKQTRIIKSNSEWVQLWGEMFESEDIAIPKIKIDFGKEMLIGVFSGQKSTGGYDVEITRVIEGENSIGVYLKETMPNPGDGVTMALTQPYYIVKIPRSDKSVNFIFE